MKIEFYLPEDESISFRIKPNDFTDGGFLYDNAVEEYEKTGDIDGLEDYQRRRLNRFIRKYGKPKARFVSDDWYKSTEWYEHHEPNPSIKI